MKTLIKKNLYYENTFSGEVEVDYKMHVTGSDQSKPSTGKHLGGRGLIFGGYTPTPTIVDTIEFFNIGTMGSRAIDFGELTQARGAGAACSNGFRGVYAGGQNSTTKVDAMEYITFASAGDAVDFGGELTAAIYQNSSTSDGSRGIWFPGGPPSPPNVAQQIEYVAISASGTDAADFGDITEARRYGGASCNGYRAVHSGGVDVTAYNNNLEFITVGTLGNSVDIGDLNFLSGYASACDDSSRAVHFAGHPGPQDSIDYFNIGTESNASDFGEALSARPSGATVSDGSRGLYAGGEPASDIVEYFQIGFPSNTVDYSELSAGNSTICGTSGN